jgi:hypothetical protein
MIKDARIRQPMQGPPTYVVTALAMEGQTGYLRPLQRRHLPGPATSLQELNRRPPGEPKGPPLWAAYDVDMADIVLFHHAQGLSEGVLAFAEDL